MILKVLNNENYPAADGVWVWNGHGWDNKMSKADIAKPMLCLKDGNILWLGIPEAEKIASDLAATAAKEKKKDEK